MNSVEKNTTKNSEQRNGSHRVQFDLEQEPDPREKHRTDRESVTRRVGGVRARNEKES